MCLSKNEVTRQSVRQSLNESPEGKKFLAKISKLTAASQGYYLSAIKHYMEFRKLDDVTKAIKEANGDKLEGLIDQFSKWMISGKHSKHFTQGYCSSVRLLFSANGIAAPKTGKSKAPKKAKKAKTPKKSKSKAEPKKNNEPTKKDIEEVQKHDDLKAVPEETKTVQQA